MGGWNRLSQIFLVTKCGQVNAVRLTSDLLTGASRVSRFFQLCSREIPLVTGVLLNPKEVVTDTLTVVRPLDFA